METRESLIIELKKLNDEEEILCAKRQVIIDRVKEIRVELFKIENDFEVGKEIEYKKETVKIASIRCEYGSPIMFYVKKKKDGTYGTMQHRYFKHFQL